MQPGSQSRGLGGSEARLGTAGSVPSGPCGTSDLSAFPAALPGWPLLAGKILPPPSCHHSDTQNQPEVPESLASRTGSGPGGRATHTKPRKASRPSPTEARGAGQQRGSARAGLGGILRLRGGLGTCGLAPDAVCRVCRRHRGSEQLGAALGFQTGRVGRVK